MREVDGYHDPTITESTNISVTSEQQKDIEYF